MGDDLSRLMRPAMTTMSEIIQALSVIQSRLGQLNPDLKGSATALAQNSSATAAADFIGLGAQSFQESVNVHLKLTDFFTKAFQALESSAEAFFSEVEQANWKYDGMLSDIQNAHYAPNNPRDRVAQGAREAFMQLQPYTAMGTNVIAGADGNAILESGLTVLDARLQNAYRDLVARVEQEHIELPFSDPPVFTNSSDAEEWARKSEFEQHLARQMILNALELMRFDIAYLYICWGVAVESAFSHFKSALTTAEQQLQPAIDLLSNPNSALSIFDLIHIISGDETPIAITQIGPDRILVSISGTELENMSFDTNIWNALGTGMGQEMPYERDVILAIQMYCAEHGLVNPQVVLAGHSLGGMVAQQVAARGLFNVTQVVTYGSPVMEDPVPGIQYTLYTAQWDPISMLSRYENPNLPGSLEEVAKMFPNVQTDYQGFKNPLSWSALKHDAGAVLHDAKITAENIEAGTQNVANIGNLSGDAGSSYANMLTPGLKKDFMDPYAMYGNSIQIVPDLTSKSPAVHSAYGDSQWLEGQKIYQNMPGSGFLSSTEYFGMPDMPQTAQIDEYMKAHSSAGQILSQIIPQ